LQVSSGEFFPTSDLERGCIRLIRGRKYEAFSSADGPLHRTASEVDGEGVYRIMGRAAVLGCYAAAKFRDED
jgi:hypothetical protein